MSGRKDFEERKEIKREIYEKRIEKAKQNSKAEYDKHKYQIVFLWVSLY